MKERYKVNEKVSLKHNRNEVKKELKMIHLKRKKPKFKRKDDDKMHKNEEVF